MASGIREVSYVFGSKIFLLVLGISTQSLIAWLLGPVGCGEYAVCVVFASLLTVFCILGCDKAFLYFVASRKFNLSEALSNVLVLGTIGSVLAVLTGFFMMNTSLSFFSKASPVAFQLALVTIPISLFSNILLNTLVSLRQFGWLSIANIISAIVQILLVAICVWKLRLNVNGILIALIINGLITNLALLVFFRWKFNIKMVAPSVNILRQMLSYGFRVYFSKISILVNSQISTVVLATFATKGEIGFYALATSLLVKIMIIPNELCNILLPRVAQDKVGQRDLVAQMVRLTGIFTFAGLFIVVIFAKSLVATLFSPAFLPAVPLILLLVPGILLRSTSKLFGPYFNGINRPEVNSIANIFGVVINLIGLLCLMPVLGVKGAALAMSAGYLVSSCYLVVSFKRFSGMGYWEILRIRETDVELFRRMIIAIRGKLSFSLSK